MKSKTVLDKLDWNILSLLQENAKQTYTDIGKKLDVAHSTIYDRIKRMEKLGVIEKYQVVISPEKAGIQQISAFITVYAEPKDVEIIAAQLSQFEEILEVSTSFSDELVINAKLVSKNQSDLHSFIARTLAPLLGVLKIKTSIITKKFKEESSQPIIENNVAMPKKLEAV